MFNWLRPSPYQPQLRKSTRRRLRLEALENRLALATFSVLHTGDMGPGSFNQAILDAKASSGPDRIEFSIGGGGVQTLSPAFQLPTITDPVTIDGTTQPGYAGTPLIELSGVDAPFGSNGLVIVSGQSTVRGLAINRYSGPTGLIHETVAGSGIVLQGGSRNVIEGNFIGTDVTGTVARRNTGDGVAVVRSSRNMIGGTADGAGNVISGNGRMGVYVQHGNINVVSGNKIGTNVAGAAKVGNGLHGVLVRADFSGPGSSNNMVGGTTPAARNIISGNRGSGVGFSQETGTGNVVVGNYIGADVTGTINLGNAEDGVTLSNAGGNSTVGGTAVGAGNVISGNERHGVSIGASQFNQVLGNLIGTDATGTNPLGNSGAGVAFALQAFANNNVVGGSAPGARNVVSANGGDGILFHSGSFNVVQGNYIGTDITGGNALGNSGWGVHIAFGPPHGSNFNTRSNVIGTSGDGVDDATEGNVIAANAAGGVLIRQGTTRNVVAGNRIGADSNGAIMLGNGNGPGVSITEDAPINRIGTNGDGVSDALEANVIIGHMAGGVIVQGAGSTRNSIRGNSIFANTGLGIDLGNNGPTPNHLGAASGPNEFQNYPVVAAAVAGPTTQVAGTLISLPNTTFTLEFFANGNADPSGFGEGERLLGSETVTTDANGNASFNVALPGSSASGEFISATATSPTGNTSEFSAVIVTPSPSSLSGIAWVDFNNDGEVNFGETGIAGVAIELIGTDFLGNPVDVDALTDADGEYAFLDLLPGSYTVKESQPPSYLQGINSVGTAGGSLAAIDEFFVQLPGGINGMNYNFGERPAATDPIQHGQAATIGFWHNNNGQALIKSLNGGAHSQQLANWLATSFSNLYGSGAGTNNLAGKTNAQVADYYLSLFKAKGQRLEAQVLAAALAVYVTNSNLAGTTAAAYGFTVSDTGLGTSTLSVGSNGGAFAVANNSTITVLDLLFATNDQTVNGVLYNGNKTLRDQANRVYSAVNERGDIP